MNKGLVDKLVDSTTDWNDTYEYNDVIDADMMYNTDSDTIEVLRDLYHEVDYRISTDWRNDF